MKIQKSPIDTPVAKPVDHIGSTSDTTPSPPTVLEPNNTANVNVSHPVEPVKDSINGEVVESSVAAEVGTWTKVHGKKSSSPKQHSNANVLNPGQLPIFTALSKSMSKGQLKRARNAAGRGSPKTK
ncbi:hypothetical protein ACET3Z_010412 [Daucus carota]